MDTPVTRRDLLKLSAGAVAASSLVSVTDLASPRPAAAQTPKRGGVFRFPGFDPPNFDPHQNVHWWTFIYLSMTHSGLVRHKAGPSVTPGTLPIEGDLAESWDQPNETTYVFKLKRGYDIQRLCAQQAYYLYVSPSAKVLSAWEPYVKNFSPNVSLDYGGRLQIAWLDR